MLAGQKLLAVIPARGGSKGVPGKNIREVAGKPLIAWSIEAAQRSRFVDRVILSSDDTDIIRVAKEFECDVPFVREQRLAQDDTPTIDVVLDALDRCPGYDWVLLLQPTSPLRTTEDIDEAADLCIQHRAPACVSVCPVQKSPYWMFELSADDQLQPLLSAPKLVRRQELPPIYCLNGAIYLARTEWFRQHRAFIAEGTVAYKMPLQRSFDLDTELDFQQLRIFLEDR